MASNPSTTEASPSLGRAAASGAAWLGLTQAVRLALTIGATMIIARLLTPADYGVIAMTAPLFTFLAMFQDFGLTAATIQSPQLSQAQSNTLFWANTAASAALAALTLAAAPLVGLFYHDARAAMVTGAGALSIVVGGLALQHSALLTRQLRFKRVAIVETTGLVATYATTLLLAFLLRNYWALFVGTFAGMVVQSALTWRASGFRPDRPSLRGAGDLLRFGGHVTGFNLTNFLYRNLDTVLVARFSGAAQAGVYDRSYRFLMLPLNSLAGPLSRVLMPVLREMRDDPERYRRTFLGAVRALSLAIIPAVAVSAALAEPLMLFLLGPHWAAAGPVYFWLALVGLMQPISNPLGLLYISQGRGKEFMYWGLVSAAVGIAAFTIAAKQGGVGMAKALFLSSFVLMPLRFGWAVRGTPVPVSSLYAEQFVPLFGAGIVALVAWRLQGQVPFLPLLIASTLLAYLAAVVTTSITRHSRERNRWLWRYFRDHLPSPRRVRSI